MRPLKYLIPVHRGWLLDADRSCGQSLSARTSNFIKQSYDAAANFVAVTFFFINPSHFVASNRNLQIRTINTLLILQVDTCETFLVKQFYCVGGRLKHKVIM